MAINLDIISTTILTEYGGVQMLNKLYWQIDDVGNDPTDIEGLQDIMTAYGDSVRGFANTDWKIVCGIYENLTTPIGKIIKFNTDAGLSVDQGPSQDQVLRINRWAGQPDFAKVHRGAFNQGGLPVTLSIRGRAAQLTPLTTLKNFLTLTQAMAGGNWVIQPFLRWQLTAGPPPTFSETAVIHSEISPIWFKLRSRKTKLCAVA